MAISFSITAKFEGMGAERKMDLDKFRVEGFGTMHIMEAVYNCLMLQLRDDLMRNVYHHELTADNVTGSKELNSCTLTVNLLGLDLDEAQVSQLSENLESMLRAIILRQERLMNPSMVMNLGEYFDLSDLHAYVSKNDPGKATAENAVDDPQASDIVKKHDFLGIQAQEHPGSVTANPS